MRTAVVLAALSSGAACSSPAATPDAPADTAADAGPLATALPMHLRDTGLYSDFGAKVVSDGLRPFAPANILWSDGAVKTRWIELPPGAEIDTSDMDHWVFPVGTKWFKQFALNGKRLETRMIWRVADTGDKEKDTLFGAYVWDDAEDDAVFAKDGAENIRGTDHDAPAADQCWRCHVGEPGRSLGFSALQLGTVDDLPLSNPPAAGTHYAAPNAALGYLHANCGHCHNPQGGAWTNSDMILRLDVAETDATANQIVQTTVGVDVQQWLGHGYTKRIVAGDPAQSAIFARMSMRAPNIQMPPIATEYVDDNGVELLRSWITSL